MKRHGVAVDLKINMRQDAKNHNNYINERRSTFSIPSCENHLDRSFSSQSFRKIYFAASVCHSVLHTWVCLIP